MKPLYKVGDNVLVKSKLDQGCTKYDYRFALIEDMRCQLGGKVCTIKNVVFGCNVLDGFRVPDDGHIYRLKEDEHCWSWASSMFEPEF